MKHGFLVAAVVAAGATFARADEIVLANGHTIKGARSVESKDPNRVIFDVGAGRIELDRKQVSAVNPGRTALHDYDDKYNAIKNSTKAGDFWDLAQWCKQNKLSRYVGSLCVHVVRLDPGHDAAHKELRHEKLDGKWHTYEQAMEKKGFKLVGDRWMTKAEIQLEEKRRLEAKERDLARKAEAERRRTEELERRQAEAEAAADWYARQVADLDGYFYQPSAFWPAYFRPYPWASYQRSRRNYQYGGGSYGGGIGTFDLYRFMPQPFLKK
ncbi:MAG TPA: hypothetical protein VJB14_17800 [Planctomycetota bacterium]|nr:hypothetical protein [Planctomycetota bacterium]